MIEWIKAEVIPCIIALGAFAYEVGVLVVAAGVIGIITIRRWKPHLSIDQSASWRRMDDGSLCITVAIRYRNTSNYRAIRVQKMVVELQRLAPLSPEQSVKASEDGRSALPLLERKEHRWNRDKSRLLQPGGTEFEVFLFFVSSKEPRLSAFVIYTFVFRREQPADKSDSMRNQRGWGIATCHDIDTKGEA